MNIALLLQMAAEAEPDRIALICGERRWSYHALWQASQGAASIFHRHDCQFVALLDESSEATPIALFGAALAGIPYVPLNYRLANEDLAALLQRITPSCAIGDVERIQQLDSQSHHICFTRQGFVAEAESATTPFAEHAQQDGIAAQIFTSGTTSAPKAALLKHANLLSYILGTVEFASAAPEEASLVCVPPYHIAGIAALLSSVYSLRKILLLPAFDPNDWLLLASEERATNAFLVPTMLSRIITRLDEGVNADLSALKAIAYGGGPMPTVVIERAMQLFPHCGFTNAYGLTETSSTIALLGPEDHRTAYTSNDPAVRARLGSVGRPLPTIELEIRDDEGNRLPAGQRGEIYVRGEQVSGEYRERKALDPDGWFPTRDAGWLDEDGFLFLAGRADDVIVRGGENISPGEIEEVLLSHPSIADAAAVAVPSTEWGETVGIAITVKPGCAAPHENELRLMIKDRLRSSRVPEHIKIMDALPYNEMGKLLRREIRRMFVD